MRQMERLGLKWFYCQGANWVAECHRVHQLARVRSEPSTGGIMLMAWMKSERSQCDNEAKLYLTSKNVVAEGELVVTKHASHKS